TYTPPKPWMNSTSGFRSFEPSGLTGPWSRTCKRTPRECTNVCCGVFGEGVLTGSYACGGLGEQARLLGGHGVALGVALLIRGQLLELAQGVDRLLWLLRALELLDADQRQDAGEHGHDQEDHEERQGARHEVIQQPCQGKEEEEGGVCDDHAGSGEQAHAQADLLAGLCDLGLRELNLGADEGGGLCGGVLHQVADAPL